MVKDRIPEESETIAARRSVRVANKIKKTKRRFKIYRSWWSNGPVEVLSLILIFALNFFLVYPLFGVPATLTAFSGPVIPFLAKGLSFLNVDFAHAIQIIYLAFYLLFPLSFYLFVRMISGRKLVAFIATLSLSLPVYPFALTRINAGFKMTDGPHVASMALIPLALYGLYLFMQKGGFRNLFMASVFSSLVVLTSPFGFSILIALAFITTFSGMLLGGARLKFLRLLMILLIAAGLSSFWYNPQFAISMTFGPMGEEIRSTVSKLVPLSFFLVPILAAFGYLLFDRKPDLQALFLASFYAISFGLVILVGGGLFPSHPSRYMPEFGMSLAFLIGVTVGGLIDYLRLADLRKFKFLAKIDKNFLANSLFFLVILLFVLMTVFGRSKIESQEETDVVGLWVERGEIWVARDEAGRISSLLGYVVTGSTISGLSIAQLGMRRKKR